MNEDNRENEEVRQPDEEQNEEEMESEGGGGKVGIIIIGLLVVAVLAAAYLNKQFYGEREPRRVTEFDDEGDPWPGEDDPAVTSMPQQPDTMPEMSMEEEYRAFIGHNRMLAGQYIFSANERLYIMASFPRQGIDQEGREVLNPGRMFDVTNMAEGVGVRSLYRRMIGPDQILFSDMFPPLGHAPNAPAPLIIPAAELNLPSDDRLVSMTVNEETRAYPIKFLNYHEVVNDEIGETPVAIAWSALADGAFALDRRLDDETTLHFGSSGLLYKGVAVIYDVESRSLWSPMTGKCLAGEHVGEKLNHLQATRTNWSYWSERHPESTTLAGADPQFEGLDYSDNPQIPTETYYTDDAIAHPVEGFNFADSPVDPKTTVAGLAINDSAAAYPLALLSERGEITDTIGDREITVRYVAEGGYAEFLDADGAPLLNHRTFWMVWQGHYPDTRLYGDHDDSPETLETPLMPGMDQPAIMD